MRCLPSCSCTYNEVAIWCLQFCSHTWNYNNKRNEHDKEDSLLKPDQFLFMIWRFLGDWNEITLSCGSSLKSTLVLGSISLIAHVLLLLFGENEIFYTCLFYKFPNSKIYIYSDYHNVLITAVIITMQYLFMFIDSE